ncbi:putative secreted protein (Por secretion system target) [Chryseobacterium sp. 52]|uniref:T9SS type A sorting domain-containing protein n=1 Tax=Chryseobacterium sp. 52 TaxID=2035213 RepID=UPI000C1A5708|nr:T9SS type A sorting domain-containing protein [Chryseobacterium sp. 52]PIF44555.1 putative secreted protein (Por secretion system target) [Chryseobacterium sp. 52]
MKKTLLLFFLISFAFLFGQITKKVFFVGNSYTYTNDLPVLIQSIAASTGDVLDHQSHVQGGARLKQHAENPIVTSAISQGNWDYVVLQEQSQIPSFPNTFIQAEMHPYAKQLAERIKNSNGCGNPIFFMTWGYKTGDATNCTAGNTAVCTYEGMDDLIYSRYMDMAQLNESIISPVGKVWRTISQQYPSMELYSGDGSHPSYLGSMAAAYTFYTILFKKDPEQAPFNGNLTLTESQILKSIVKNTVYNHLDTWFVGANDVASRFKYQAAGNSTLQFTNQTQNATTFSWNFGDGNTSALEHPTHHYPAAGTYQVSLTTNACGNSSTKTKSITISNLGTKDENISKVRIYPNPVQDFIHITTAEKWSVLSLTDTSGQILSHNLEKTDSGYSIPVHHLSCGIYFLKYKTGEKEYTKKIIKK